MASQNTDMEGGSSVSSIESHGAGRSTGVVRYCNCGKIAPMWTSWSMKNPGRKFIGCRNYRINGYCGFFAWIDPPICDRAKEILPDLRNTLLRCKDEVAKISNQNIELKEHVKELEQQSVKMKRQLEKLNSKFERSQKRGKACWKAVQCLCILVVMVVLSSVNGRKNPGVLSLP